MSGVIEVDERLRADGAVELPLDMAPLRDQLEAAIADGIDAAAIVLMHAWKTPDHEAGPCRNGARDGLLARSRSATRFPPLVKLVGRGDTTVVDAYLSPILRRYVARVADALGGHARGRAGADAAIHDVLGRHDGGPRNSRARTRSCPAPRAVSWAWSRLRVTRVSRKVIGFDMGGTSTDRGAISRAATKRAFDTEVAGRAHSRAPMMRNPHRRRRWRLDPGMPIRAASASGPDSAGANPGPACLPPRPGR